MGDPLLAPVDDDRVALRLEPGDRVGLGIAWSSARRLHVLAAPPLGAGLTARGRTSLLEPGTTIELDGSGPHVVWNHGPGAAVVVSTSAASGARFAWMAVGRRRRAARRQYEEASAALQR